MATHCHNENITKRPIEFETKNEIVFFQSWKGDRLDARPESYCPAGLRYSVGCYFTLDPTTNTTTTWKGKKEKKIISSPTRETFWTCALRATRWLKRRRRRRQVRRFPHAFHSLSPPPPYPVRHPLGYVYTLNDVEDNRAEKEIDSGRE